MLYKIDKKSKINCINLINTFIPKDDKTSEDEKKLLKNIEKILLNGEKLSEKTIYGTDELIKTAFAEMDFELKGYLKEILLEINDKNSYKLFSTESENNRKLIESLN